MLKIFKINSYNFTVQFKNLKLIILHIFIIIITVSSCFYCWRTDEVYIYKNLLAVYLFDFIIKMYTFFFLYSHSMSKLFGKLYFHLKPLIEERHLIPHHQFGLWNKHSPIHQFHHVKNVIRMALEEYKYCCG